MAPLAAAGLAGVGCASSKSGTGRTGAAGCLAQQAGPGAAASPAAGGWQLSAGVTRRGEAGN